MNADHDPAGRDFTPRDDAGWTPEQVPPLPGDEWMSAIEASDPMTGGVQEDDTTTPDPADDIPPTLQLAFAPLHKRAFGTAVGVACALLIGAVTAFHLMLNPEGPNISLLSQYFYGYTVTWTGLLVGMGWGFAVGFVAGWFFAFCRNLALAASIFINRTRAELEQTRDFLDHI